MHCCIWHEFLSQHVPQSNHIYPHEPDAFVFLTCACFAEQAVLFWWVTFFSLLLVVVVVVLLRHSSCKNICCAHNTVCCFQPGAVFMEDIDVWAFGVRLIDDLIKHGGWTKGYNLSYHFLLCPWFCSPMAHYPWFPLQLCMCSLHRSLRPVHACMQTAQGKIPGSVSLLKDQRSRWLCLLTKESSNAGLESFRIPQHARRASREHRWLSFVQWQSK